MADRPEPLRGFLRGATLLELRAQLECQAEVLRAVRQALPDFLGVHCRHCVVREGCLRVYVDTPAFASQLRFYVPSLLERLNGNSGRGIREVRVRNLLPVATGAGLSHPQPRRNAKLSAGAEVLLAAAEGTASDDIKAALMRLGRTLRDSR